MLAPPGHRWSLSRCRWWGGWAEGENVDTLMKYLLDSLQRAETSHADALNPVFLPMDESYMGEDDLLQVPTKAEFRLFFQTLDEKLAQSFSQLAVSAEQKILDVLTSFRPATTATIAPYEAHPDRVSAVDAHRADMFLQDASPHYTLPSQDMYHGLPATTSLPTTYILPPHGTPFSNVALQPLPRCHPRPSTVRHSQMLALPPPPTRLGPAHVPVASLEGEQITKTSSSPPVPQAGVEIPSVGRGPGAWLKAAQQWVHGVPALGIPPLKDWDIGMHKGPMRLLMGSLYNQRRRIGEEYIRLGCNEERFEAEYSDADRRTITALLDRIRAKAATARRTSKNGPPEQRMQTYRNSSSTPEFGSSTDEPSD
ncbi:hypothetical protein BD626DRAFT_533627 [Schizophyllum amplum]|uniref:Uncharacterized protein n=1 Tax=Schizophyllum amplum TaxID=97359 RepID=A0A550CZW9_9AGAR|nr:hypothetical protein BD626DRAFT_533627 [Auriculariopsis ampla]